MPARLKSALSELLPLQVKGISMNDGSISFGPRDIKIVLGYVTNAVSSGDWLRAAAKSKDGRAGTDNPDTRVTQMRCADEIVRAANHHDALREALEPFAHYFDLNDCAERNDDDALEVPIRDLKRAHEAIAALVATEREKS